MQIVIDIDKEEYKIIKSNYENGFTYKPFGIIVNGTPIPDNATNGDMIKVVFPDIALYEKNHDAIEISFNGVWWNAPYQKGGK